GGGIGKDGPVEGCAVVLDGKLARFDLPPPPEGDDLKKAVRDSLGLLNFSKPEYAALGLGAVYRAPLGAIDVSVFFEGPTAGGQSALAALFQQHFGAELSRVNLPGNWLSTSNSLEAQLFLAKDCLFVIDDFRPGGGKGEQDLAHRLADRIFRSVGNASSRQR